MDSVLPFDSYVVHDLNRMMLMMMPTIDDYVNVMNDELMIDVIWLPLYSNLVTSMLDYYLNLDIVVD